ncbi:MAG TPA: hypothetical protein VK892_04345 [Pyrinomonadaceae bacterium]|nr:hypothetical protein [Pyrinomonadaceae bacterium]
MKSPLNKTFFEKISIGEILSWETVSEIHRVRNGIYQQNERLISLLTDFGRINPCYPDFEGENKNEIFYTGAGRRGDQKLDAFNRAMFAAIESGHSVPLFNKLAVGRWEFLGLWQVMKGEYIFDEKAERMIWKFLLRRVDKI